MSIKANLSIATASLNLPMGYKILGRVPAGFLVGIRKIVLLLVWKSEAADILETLEGKIVCMMAQRWANGVEGQGQMQSVLRSLAAWLFLRPGSTCQPSVCWPQSSQSLSEEES